MLQKFYIRKIGIFVLFCFFFNILTPVIIYPQEIKESPHGSFLYDQPPIIYEIKQVPEEPTIGEEVKIITKVANDPELTDERTTSVTLYYSLNNGKNWIESVMKQSEKDEKIWSATIPACDKECKVMYYISAIDTADNLTSECPEVLVDNKELNKLYLPVKLIDKNDPDKSVNPNLDVLEIQSGYDEQRLYVRVKVDGKISEGTKLPLNANAYSVFIMNSDEKEEWFLRGKSLIYLPLAHMIGLKEKVGLYKFLPPEEKKSEFDNDSKPKFVTVGLKTKEKIILGVVILGLIYYALKRTVKGISKFFEALVELFRFEVSLISDADIQYYIDNNTITLSSLRAPLGNNPSRILKLIFFTNNCQEPDIKNCFLHPQDATSYILLYMRSHSYKIKEIY